MLCPGCPHRGIFYALSKIDAVVTGDIGCYALGMLPPLSVVDVILCMGGGISMAHGMDKVQRYCKSDKRSSIPVKEQKIVGVIGDSTFFHSGITGLLDIAYNQGTSTIIVLDNRITAMTGHQENPGSGKTLMGTNANAVSIEDIGRACGINHIRTINPYDISTTISIIKEATDSEQPYLIISKAPCVLHVKQTLAEPLTISKELCKKCGTCLKIGCPAIEKTDAGLQINDLLCAGCGLCKTVCPAKAIT
jgi:indolepyruvate ferredoxin oxidoreductase alpha subunit